MVSIRITHLLLCFAIIFTFFLAANGEKKSKRMKESTTLFPRYEIYNGNQLPSDKQISAFLKMGENKTFSYSSLSKNSSMSVTVATCTSIVNWVVKFRESSPDKPAVQLSNLTTEGVQTFHLTTDKGTYFLQITPIERDTYLHVYISTEPGGPQALQNLKLQKALKLIPRQQRKKLSVRWEPSLVDPQVTDYCLVVNLLKHYPTLCSAFAGKYEVFPKPGENPPAAASQTITAHNHDKKNEKLKEPLVVCVGSRTHFTLQNLQQNQGYYFDLFAFNKQSNLTYLYGSSFVIFDKRTKPTRLKDNKSTYVNLKKFDGKVVFRYKVGKLLNDSLKFYVLPCGGAVDVDVTLKGESVAIQRRIESFGRITIPNPKIGSRYYLKIISSNKEELRRSSGVEVLATVKPSAKTPLPNMPTKLALGEHFSLKTCDSTTVAWLASSTQRPLRHCLTVREGRLRDTDSFKIPNQCGLENRLKKSADFTAKYCRDIKQEEEKVIVQKISQLKAGRSYVVQVTVKKPKGKTLSYDLLQVQTLPTCEHSKT